MTETAEPCDGDFAVGPDMFGILPKRRPGRDSGAQKGSRPRGIQAIGNGEHMHLTERFTRVDGGTIRYEYTVNDRATFTAPISAMIYLRKSQEQMFEYACHEGNYGLLNILRGARAEERVPTKSR